jgi:integrase
MPEKIETTHVLMDKVLLVYQRERSSIWQCRFKVDGKWQRASTKERDLEKAKIIADGLRIEAEIRKRSNLPVLTRKFTNVAKLAIERMEKAAVGTRGKVSFTDYIRVINEYLIPCLGKRNITSIDHAALDELDAWRTQKMGKAPSQSTMLTQNAALNRVFDEAVIHGFLTDANRPTLKAKGQASDRRPAFEMEEIRALIAGFDGWIERAKNESSKQSRLLMRDYAMTLLDTGARPGRELLELKWNKISETNDVRERPSDVPVNEAEGEQGPQYQLTLERSVEMTVTGKTGTRKIAGMQRAATALREIAIRNYPNIEMDIKNPLKNIIRPSNDDHVFRVRNTETGLLEDTSSSFQKMLERYLEEHSLLIDPKTEKKRVFYSLRHTYATFQLEIEKIGIHLLAEHMGTSVGMIEKHYSHLDAVRAIKLARNEETRRLIDAAGEIDKAYMSKKVTKAQPKAKAKKKLGKA